jgi:hypothetical protein
MACTGDRRAVPALREILGDSSPESRAHAATTIGVLLSKMPDDQRLAVVDQVLPTMFTASNETPEHMRQGQCGRSVRPATCGPLRRLPRCRSLRTTRGGGSGVCARSELTQERRVAHPARPGSRFSHLDHRTANDPTTVPGCGRSSPTSSPWTRRCPQPGSLGPDVGPGYGRRCAAAPGPTRTTPSAPATTGAADRPDDVAPTTPRP